MTDTGPISQGQRVRVERRPARGLAAHARPRTAHQPAPWPEVWEGTVLQVTYEDDELTNVEIYGKSESTGESKRIGFNLARNAYFRTRVTPIASQ
ncbi:hypothetical protein [Streptomyces phaeochromogenes]